MAKKKVLCCPPFELKIKSTNTSASIWDSKGWFLGWIGCKNLKYKYQQDLFWNQVETRLGLNDQDLNCFSHTSDEPLSIEDLKKYKRIIELLNEYEIDLDSLEKILEAHRFDNSSIEEIIYSLQSEGRLMDLF